MENFIETENYFISIFKQGTNEWLSERKNRITASDFGSASGLYTKYLTQDEFIERKKNNYEITDEFSLKCMKYGIENEALARKLYEEKTCNKVIQIGLVVPKFNLNIGASVDGLVNNDGIIEIKCPYKLYDEVKRNEYYRHKNIKSENINLGHYCQIQGQLEILNREWCDYVVYFEGKIYTYRILRDKNFWKMMYEKLLVCIEKLFLK